MAIFSPKYLAVVVLAVCVGTACGKSGGGGGAKVEPGAPAGDVVEVAGTVTATRAGAARPLRVGDTVSGDDVISTGAGGRVAIMLRHNQVRWALEPGQEKKVADSAAWTAPKGTTEVAVVDEKSGAAGRHAERSAADTSASAGPVARESAAVKPPDPRLAELSGTGLAGKPPLGRSETEPYRLQPVPPVPPVVAGAQANFGVPDERVGAFAAVDAGSGQAHESVPPAHGEPPAEIRAIVEPHRAEIRACATATASGTVFVTFTVGADGRATKLSVTPRRGGFALGCVRKVFAGLTFPAGSAPAVVTYPFELGTPAPAP